MTRTWCIFPPLSYPGDPMDRAGRRAPSGGPPWPHWPLSPWEMPSFTLQSRKGPDHSSQLFVCSSPGMQVPSSRNSPRDPQGLGVTRPKRAQHGDFTASDSKQVVRNKNQYQKSIEEQMGPKRPKIPLKTPQVFPYCSLILPL